MEELADTGMMRLLVEGAGGEHFGVHIPYMDIFSSMLFLFGIYVGGVIAVRVLSMPALVGEIFAGIIFGPSTFNLVPSPEAFVMLGEIGLILLVLEAGIDIDLTTIKLIGTRGILIALVGSFLPVLLASAIAACLGYKGMAALSAGCAFAPTSLGIAMNILRQSKIINTPVGQLIVAAAIIDDMVALVILSQLQAFTSDTVTLVDIITPVISAVSFLVGGGALAVFVLPKIIDKLLLSRTEYFGVGRGWMSMAVMFTLLMMFMPMTYYLKASPLMGAFLAGLVFCSNHDAHHRFVGQFKRLMQWLLRIFFAASIGFQVPIDNFANLSVITDGALFTLALLGKVATGFMVPNFARTKRFGSIHIKDCLVVAFSMMAEGEFAFIIAVFAVTNGLLTEEQYSSVVLAVLLSTIIAPYCLRTTISRFNKKLENAMHEASKEEADTEMEKGHEHHNDDVFYCIQTTSAPAWGLQMRIMEELSALNLDVIDHRTWHDRESDNQVVNEIYVQDTEGMDGTAHAYEQAKKIEARIEAITRVLTGVIAQEDALVKAQRWVPNLPDVHFDLPAHSLAERIVRAAGHAFEKRKHRDEGLLKEEDLYASMGPEEKRKALQGKQQITHIDERSRGHLEGFFRHDAKKDPPGYRPYQFREREGVEFLDEDTDPDDP